MNATTCPNCRALHMGEFAFDPTSGVMRMGERSSRLSPGEAGVLEFLLRRQSARPEMLIDAMYRNDIEGGPDWASKCLHVRMFRLRAQLRAIGAPVRIASTRGRGSTYWIERCEKSVAA